MNFRIGHGFDVHRLAGAGESGAGARQAGETQGGERAPETGARQDGEKSQGISVRGGLRLGGVTVPHSKGAVAHSDGDVVIHALCDALLGAAALGDIGLHFPDTEAGFRGIDSRELLGRTVALLREAGWRVGNVDCTVMLQVPRIRPFIDEMRRELAAALGVDIGAVSVKATTTERLGFIGREEGVAAEAVVLITS
jgi:2-C-methyl-D-erythritol 2,4-cyclodiphosphate synthase